MVFFIFGVLLIVAAVAAAIPAIIFAVQLLGIISSSPLIGLGTSNPETGLDSSSSMADQGAWMLVLGGGAVLLFFVGFAFCNGYLEDRAAKRNPPPEPSIAPLGVAEDAQAPSDDTDEFIDVPPIPPEYLHRPHWYDEPPPPVV